MAETKMAVVVQRELVPEAFSVGELIFEGLDTYQPKYDRKLVVSVKLAQADGEIPSINLGRGFSTERVSIRFHYVGDGRMGGPWSYVGDSLYGKRSDGREFTAKMKHDLLVAARAAVIATYGEHEPDPKLIHGAISQAALSAQERTDADHKRDSERNAHNLASSLEQMGVGWV